MPRIFNLMLKFLICVALSLGLAGPAFSASEFRGIVRVIDGDTFDIGAVRVRLYGIDAPERGQTCDAPSGNRRDCGAWVTQQVRDRWEGSPARCRALDRDRYGRIVARCFFDHTDMARRLVRDGLAFAYIRYAVDYAPDEAAALAAGRGLHAHDLEPPETFRRTGAATSASDCTIKGNIGTRGARIYHLPGQAFYDRTRIRTDRGERWFCTVDEARAAGWRATRS